MNFKNLVFAVLLGLAASLSACGDSKSPSTESEVAETFACPMKCEGDKTYDKNQSCPVCGMELVSN
jgi:hypothetical protein